MTELQQSQGCNFYMKDNMRETWKPVVGYEGWYSVSNLGQVRRDMPHAGTRKGKILKGGLNGWGYFHVSLSKGTSKRQTLKITKLVMDAFIGALPKGMVRNHKNGIKTDDSLENLEYITQSDNVLHAYRKLGVKAVNGSRNGRSLLNEEDIPKIRELHILGKLQREIAEIFGVSNITISDILRGVSWRHVKNHNKGESQC